MADSSRQDVELISQSVGGIPPSDVPATTTEELILGGNEDGSDVKLNGVITEEKLYKLDDQSFEDSSARSDTDTSRAESVVGDSKSSDAKPTKKFAASKPVSFAKYSVPKVVAANAASKVTIDKAPSAIPAVSSLQPLGRPRLVAKSASATQPKLASYKPTAPDPMQVWNKNRVTPQPSTKHLTDEELKKQYDIHLTPRLQSDGEGKEAKWADIDDDEDDWAPETIEWNDGTKTTVNAVDAFSPKQDEGVKAGLANMSKDDSDITKPAPSQFTSSIGPNATVLKIGGSLERQQAQKAAAQHPRGTSDKQSSANSQAMPAPAPAKSPWAKLPTVEKVSPVVIAPQPPTLATLLKHAPSANQVASQQPGAPSPAKEISADDFNRSWRNSPSSQTRELYMPSSGRYETVPEGRRRLSRNEPNFRAPAVLQRPGQGDVRTPAEPSAAFQTHRTSVDLGRRRASSSISGGSGQFARRPSFKSNEPSASITNGRRDSQVDVISAPSVSQDEPLAQIPAAYQARSGDQALGGPSNLIEGDIEAQRAVQKAAMRENIERARRRKQEEEQRLEQEKQERIRAKLASLGPPPEKQKPATDNPSEAPATAQIVQPFNGQSPPKPPQPQASGEPQQYGMMKVHSLDSIKKNASPATSPVDQNVRPLAPPHSDTAVRPIVAEDATPSQLPNGSYKVTEQPRPFPDDEENPEPSPKFGRSAAPVVADARAGWGRNDHRATQVGNLWGLPSNKALGNGTFDSSLAGYSPQDLSRTSSSGQPWMSGRTPTVGQSPQPSQASHTIPETRSHLLQSMTSPGQQPLSLNSEADSALPMNRPAPIRPPQPPTGPVPQLHHGTHAIPSQPQQNGLAAWNNFPNVARVVDRADAEKFQRELSERREEEKRTGAVQQAGYSFTETFKQVQLGEQAGQRYIANSAPNMQPSNHIFGAVGSSSAGEVPSRMINNQLGRGSRFFPPIINGMPSERRAVTYSHPGLSRTPSPPPAEETASYHPAHDGHPTKPVVHFPPVRPVVRLPPTSALIAPVVAPTREVTPPPVQPKVPTTWAARVSMPAPIAVPTPPTRAVSTPITQNRSWQERFNGLLGKKEQLAMQGAGHLVAPAQPAPTVAVTKEPLDVTYTVSASVSLPASKPSISSIATIASKNVEDEEDLFEDREAGSLPIVSLPKHMSTTIADRVSMPRSSHAIVESTSVHMFMVSNWSERHGQQKPQYAIIRAPGNTGKGIKRDLPSKGPEDLAHMKPRGNSSHAGAKYPRNKPGFKSRPTAKAH